MDTSSFDKQAKQHLKIYGKCDVCGKNLHRRYHRHLGDHGCHAGIKPAAIDSKRRDNPAFFIMMFICLRQ
ncbi:MAG: hypothetical protein CM15mP46_7020 [Alphaproteobacteria bacterium]|nr:MAG: hypothetical protein CM15mP46_7020 [Alphaproteobacteria bacterium]